MSSAPKEIPTCSMDVLSQKIHSRLINVDDFNVSLPLKNINLAEVESWDEIELLCASAGADVTREVVNFFIAGMLIFQNFVDMMTDQMANGDWLKKWLRTSSDFQALYLISSTGFRNQSPFEDFRRDLAYKWACEAYPEAMKAYQDVDLSSQNKIVIISDGTRSAFAPQTVISPHYVTFGNPHYSFANGYPTATMALGELAAEPDKKASEYRKALLNAVDLANPYIMLKFYSELDKSLFSDDIEFVQYLVARTEVKARYRSEFAPILNELKKDLTYLRKYKMHLD